MQYLWAFLVGGALCGIGQILIDKTKLTPARILVLYVCLGVLFSMLGIYQPLVDFAGAGATVPLTGFGHVLYKGVLKKIAEDGLVGVLSGGISASSAGIGAAVIFAFFAALLAKPKIK